MSAESQKPDSHKPQSQRDDPFATTQEVPAHRGPDDSPVDSDDDPGGASPADPVEEARSEAARMKDQWIRTAADYENFRKRARRDTEDARRAAREELLKELLPVFDNLERGVLSARSVNDAKAVADGLSMILKQFNDTLARVGINKVPTVGSAFDPSVHEAIQQVETSDHPPGTIVAEVQPGYVQGERLVRAAMVVVAKPKTDEPAN
jgi:molecular chaperone GrpE